ncbi:DNA primase [Burkholderia cepacia JBK9]|nr:DNA primase [Burkholderia cepacia JBK9]
MMNGYDARERAWSALRSLDPGVGRDKWIRIAMAARAAGLDEEDFRAWSASGANYGGANECRIVWRSIKVDGAITANTLFYEARKAGWQDPTQGAYDAAYAARVCEASEPWAKQQARARPARDLAAIFERYPPATADHPYLVAKRGVPAGLRVVPTDDPLTINGQRVAGWLTVPVRSLDGALRTIQYVPPPGKGKKLNLPGSSFGDGMLAVGDMVPDGTLYIVEGIGQAWSCAKADYRAAAVVTFGSGRLRIVAKLLHERYPNARIVITSDRGKEVDSEAIAREIGGAWVAMPANKPENYDANDYEGEHGVDALADVLRAARTPTVEFPLSVTFADELPEPFTPPDELVEGVLTTGGGSVLYGDSNCGKTFFAIDMAAAVARGVDWMGRHIEPGLVVYLAAESPASVRSRLQAYQKYHGARVPNFAIVQSPVNLFKGDADATTIIRTVLQIEAQRRQKVRLIVGDTLARLSAGANENAGQDMSLVIDRVDRIRTECKAHFMLIHHSGKNAAAGARGWSGMRCAIDTEIEVTDASGSRCAEITKVRDLGTKGERIGFRLDVLTLGVTKWGTPATTCVVVPADAPEKLKVSKRIGEVEGAVIEYLASLKIGVKKSAVVAHFSGRYEKGPVYRAMKALAVAAAIHEAAGMVCIADAAK